VDEYELNKPTVKPDIGIRMDINLFLKELLKEHIKFESNDWLNWCKKLYNKYPVMLPEYDKCFPLNPYKFSRILSEEAKDSIIICGNGSACVCMFQAGVVKNNNRFFWNAGCASMGYDHPDKHVICITGDGSIMMNLQELQTIKNYKLPIKIFILDNSGYHSIRQTQKAYFGEEIFGCDKYSGVELPNFRDIATAFKIDSWIINSPERLNSSINDVLSCSGPIICKVTIPNDYSFSPKLAPRIKDGIMVPSSIEDMCPFLSEKEMKENIYE
jgi:acetolactate synthase-1/2/3 large subunit